MIYPKPKRLVRHSKKEIVNIQSPLKKSELDVLLKLTKPATKYVLQMEKVNPGSTIWYIFERLERKGFIKLVPEESFKTGRGEKTYRITGQGLFALLAVSPPDPLPQELSLAMIFAIFDRRIELSQDMKKTISRLPSLKEEVLSLLGSAISEATETLGNLDSMLAYVATL